MPHELILSFAMIKRSIALVNQKHNMLDEKVAGAIVQAAQDVLDQKVDFTHFPLVIW